MHPIKVVEIELSQPIPTFDDLEGYAAIQGLIRLYGTPLGYVKAPVSSRRCTATTLRKIIAEQYSSSIFTSMLEQGRASASELTNPVLKTLSSLPRVEDLNEWPSVTVAVCTRDRPDDLKMCLDALCQLDYSNLDILVVDNAPKNELIKEVVETYRSLVRYVSEPRPGLDWARNRAILESRSEIIAYTDDDVLVDPAWVKQLVRVFSEDAEVMAVTGLIVPYELEAKAQVLFEMGGGFGKGFEYRRFHVKRGDKLPWWYLGAGNYGAGANMAYRRSVFKDVGFFNPALDVGTPTNGGGDQEMFFRVIKEGHALAYQPKAMVRHRHRKSYEKLRSQLAGNGGSYSYMLAGVRRYPDESLSFLKLGIVWMVSWHLRRLLTSLIRPGQYPRDLILAEIKGCIGGFRNYKLALERVKEIEKDFGHQTTVMPSNDSELEIALAPENSSGVTADTLVEIIDLDQDFYTLSHASNYSKTHIYVQKNRHLISDLVVENNFQSIHASRLRRLIFDRLYCGFLEEEPASIHNAKSESLLQAVAKNDHALSLNFKAVGILEEPFPGDLRFSILIKIDTEDNYLTLLLSEVSNQISKVNFVDQVIIIKRESVLIQLSELPRNFPNLVIENICGNESFLQKGLKNAVGDVLITVGSNIASLPQHWLEEIAAPFARSSIGGVVGNILPCTLEDRDQVYQELSRYDKIHLGFAPCVLDADWLEKYWFKPSPVWWIGGTDNAAFRMDALRSSGLVNPLPVVSRAQGLAEDGFFFYKLIRQGFHIQHVSSCYAQAQTLFNAKSLNHLVSQRSRQYSIYHLALFVIEKDWRSLAELFVGLPKSKIMKMKDSILRRTQYPVILIFLEIYNHLIGIIEFFLYLFTGLIERKKLDMCGEFNASQKSQLKTKP
ncbi:MAG: glycosyltransferase [Nodosilinea sp. WJT8-NPBG4]|jgi:glycosyltransferase involved in cell wall biosynthesis|nr:glycosyltransferase [Nodosilinea sp. WJT8-NPBG4]